MQLLNEPHSAWRPPKKEKVSEKETAEKVEKENTAVTIDELRERYQQLYNKPVANAKKNKREWIEDKIQEAEEAQQAKAKNKEKYDALTALSFDEIVQLVNENENLKEQINTDEYDEDDYDELLSDICDELEITPLE